MGAVVSFCQAHPGRRFCCCRILKHGTDWIGSRVRDLPKTNLEWEVTYLTAAYSTSIYPIFVETETRFFYNAEDGLTGILEANSVSTVASVMSAAASRTAVTLVSFSSVNWRRLPRLMIIAN